MLVISLGLKIYYIVEKETSYATWSHESVLHESSSVSLVDVLQGVLSQFIAVEMIYVNACCHQRLNTEKKYLAENWKSIQVFYFWHCYCSTVCFWNLCRSKLPLEGGKHISVCFVHSPLQPGSVILFAIPSEMECNFLSGYMTHLKTKN